MGILNIMLVLVFMQCFDTWLGNRKGIRPLWTSRTSNLLLLLLVVLCCQARIVVVVTTEHRNLLGYQHFTRLTAAGRLACDHRGYLCQVPANSTVSSVRRLLRPVSDLLQADTRSDRQRRRSVALSTRMSEFDNQPVITVSRVAADKQK